MHLRIMKKLLPLQILNGNNFDRLVDRNRSQTQVPDPLTTLYDNSWFKIYI